MKHRSVSINTSYRRYYTIIYIYIYVILFSTNTLIYYASLSRLIICPTECYKYNDLYVRKQIFVW